MTRNSKRGFTLVELIIVIAVIGVLAAILIPVFSNVVKKANIADKTSLARNLNTQLAAEGEGTARVATMGEAMAIAHRQGYTDDQIFNTQTAGTIVFNNATGNFAVVEDVENDGTANFAYADQGMTSAPAGSLMAPVEVSEIPAVADQVYGMYLIDSSNTPVSYTVDAAVSVDVGDVSVTTLNFATTKSGDFTFRTVGGIFNVDAQNANVNHYGYADTVNITAVATHSYHEFGIVGIINITAGHLVIESGANVLQGVKVIDASAVTVSLFAHAAIVGDENALQGIISDNTGSNNVEYVATMPEAIGFAGGSGTEADPYLIATPQHFANIQTTYQKWGWVWNSSTSNYDWYDYEPDQNYVYFKVMDGVNVLDISKAGTGLVSMQGQFDGNGCKVIGVTRYGMFNAVGMWGSSKPTVIKNFSFEANIVKGGGHYGALVYSVDNDIVIEKVDAHGYIESAIAASYIAYGNGWASNPANMDVWKCTFRNCTSDMTVVSTNEVVAGFIAHPYCGNNSVITLENSKFIGRMANTGTRAYKYVTGNSSGTHTINITTNEPLAIAGYEQTGTFSFQGNDVVQYNATAKMSRLNKGTLEAPAQYGVFTVAAATGATTAKAYLNIGPNGTNESGNFLGTFMEEDLTLNNGSFTTQNIKRYKLTVNGDATPRTGVSEDGHTFNIVSGNHGHTIGSANVTIKLYDANGNIVGVYTFAFVAGTDFQATL